MRIVMWGTFDLSRPRNRLTMQACRDAGVELVVLHWPVWSGVEDKSQVKGLRSRLKVVLRLLLAYPVLIFRYLTCPRHDAVLVGYLGHLDVIVLWPFAKLRRNRIVWDAFLSLPDTVVNDREMVAADHPLARLLTMWERLACRAADVVVLDTGPHARLFQESYGLSDKKLAVVPVGAEPEFYQNTGPAPAIGERIRILFYGQFIPLHGIETIVSAAKARKDAPYDWVLVGRGQEEGRIRKLVDNAQLPNLTWIEWLDYDALLREIAKADICLGIFGDSAKAARVVPNKVYQLIAANKPLVTRQSPGMAWLLGGDRAVPGLYLVPESHPKALAVAVDRHFAAPVVPEYASLRESFSSERLGKLWLQIFRDLADPVALQKEAS